MSAKLFAVRGEAPPVREPVAADLRIEGAPMTETRIDYEQGGVLFAGEWKAGVGAWRVAYDEWEFCHVLEGECELIPDNEAPRRFRAGDSFVIEPGFSGVWCVLAPMRKRFVVRSA